MKCTQHIAYFKVPYKQKDKNNDNFCCGNKKSSKGDGITDNENPELNQFYYHSDHLGSSSYITNLNGSIVQHVEYVPFGEVFLEEKNNKWNTPYLFNSKELDEETGFYYYGARYYNSRNSIFLSVDPLWEAKPSFSPYNYCSWNPVMRVDPDGRLDGNWFDEKTEKQAQKMEKKIDDKINNLNKSNASDKNDRIAELQKSKSDISDMRNDKNNQYKFDKASNNGNAPETKRTGANEITIFTDDIAKQIHENRHGGQIARKEYDIDMSGNVTEGTFGVSKEIDAYRAQYSFEGKIEYIPYIDFDNQTNLINFTLKGANSFKQTITNMRQINNIFIQNLVDNPGINQTFIYPNPAVNPTYYKK